MYKNLLQLLFIYLLLFSCFQLQAQKSSTYDQLVSVNTQWKNQPDASAALYKQVAVPLPEQQLIQLHLQETEKLLRSRKPVGLSPLQMQNRMKNLDVLHEYWQVGLFPINSNHENRQPYFIDDHNTYCAVGYLMKMSGADAMAKAIHHTQNFNYLVDIHYPDLMNWVAHSGLTLDELALIQPSYGGEWPTTLVEMHYNNIGQDINEFIEVHRGNGFFRPLTKLLFYDHLGNLYKTLTTADLQLVNPASANGFYYYQFPAGENFADSGKIVLKGTDGGLGEVALSTVDYNSAGIRLEDPTPYTAPQVRQYAAKEDNNTPVGSSLTFCGLYYTTWSPSVLPNTSGTVNPCTVGSVPINLLSFSYQVQDKTIRLDWQTATETNNDYFELQRSGDGINFTPIGKIKGAGTSTLINRYTYTDKTPDYLNHYRLKQVDKDGKSSYSKILYVTFNNANPLVIVQNPVKGTLQIQVNSRQPVTGSIIIYDMLGKVLINANVRNGSYNMNVSKFASGKYVVRFHTNEGQVYGRQFVKE